MHDRRVTLMVSSAVYGQEEVLDQVYAVLTGFGFEVWMSRKGTLPLTPGLSAFENCLSAVDQCDIFFGIITGRYGTGRDGPEDSITHREMVRAIDTGKPRFFAVHRDIVIAREILNQFRFDSDGKKRDHTFLKSNTIIDDARILDMYEYATRSTIPLNERKDNWVQQFISTDDLLLFIQSQFSDPNRLKSSLVGWEAQDDE